jgi:hypothetical protein
MRTPRPIRPAALAAAALIALLAAPAFSEDRPRLIPRPDLFETLVNPSCSHLTDEAKRRPGELVPDERVLAWIRGYSEGGCIPHRFFFSRYPVISDTYGVFVCDPVAGFARAFEPSLDFTFHGFSNGVMVMRHKDGSLFSTLSGRALEGPRKGERLKPVPSIATSWGFWFRAYPRAVTYQLVEKFQRAELRPERSLELSRASRGPVASGLDAEEEVLGLELGEEARAYRLADLGRSGGVVRDRVGGREVTVLWFAPTRTAAAYSPRAEGEGGQPVTLHYDGSDPLAPFRDRETSSFWGVEGRARSGKLEGKTLEWLPAVQCRWFAWSAEYPRTALWKPVQE